MNSSGKTKRDSIIAKVRALLSKTVEAGCTEQEAMKAAALAATLMAKYDLEMDDLDARDEGVTEREIRLDPVFHRHMKLISMAISNLCGVRTWGVAERPDTQVFFGLPHDVEVAGYLSAICERALKDELTKASAGWSLFVERRRTKLADSFLAGMSSRLCQRLRELAWARHKATANALVPVKDGIIEEALAEKGIKLYDDRVRGVRDIDPARFMAGLAAGERVRLDPAVGATPGRDAID